MEQTEISDKLDDAIARMADMTRAATDGQKALHYSQSAVNLANCKSVVQNLSHQKTAMQCAVSNSKSSTGKT